MKQRWITFLVIAGIACYAVAFHSEPRPMRHLGDEKWLASEPGVDTLPESLVCWIGGVLNKI